MNTPTQPTDITDGAAPAADAVGAVPCARPLRRDAQRNRDRIVQAAAEVFAADGLEVQMDAVARRAEVGVGTVYRHFPTKEALIAELVRRKMAVLFEIATAALEVEDPWEGFAAMITGSVEMMERDAAVRDALQRAPQAWLTCETERADVEAVAAKVIDRAKAAGVLRADFQVSEIAMTVCGISSAMTMSIVPQPDWRRLLAIVLDGLRVR